MSDKVTPRLWQAGLLALALGAGCGGSASRHDGDLPKPGSTGGDAGDANSTAGTNSTTGGTGALAGGGDGGNAASATDGGSPDNFGGAPDAGAPPVLVLPSGCQPSSPMETDDLCSLRVDCDAAPSVRTYCHRLESGLWECQCANQDGMYRLENAAGLPACALAAQLCSDTQLEVGKETCEHTSESSDATSCVTELACSSPIDLGATTEAQAWRMRFGGAHCQQFDPGTAFGCACQDQGSTTYSLVADSAELACGPLVDFCMTGAPPVFDGAETCVPSFHSLDSEGCYRGEGCGPHMRLTDEVSLVHAEQRYATCTPRSGGGSDCSCSNQDTAFLFQLSTPPDDASCEAAIPNCNPNAVIKTTGAAICTQVPDTSAGDTCQVVLNCTQAATIDGRSIVGLGSLAVACGRTGSGMPWACSFASGPKTARLALGAANSNASQACKQASTAFLQNPGLYLGPAGDLVTPPDPLP
ncbi:MAG: hypothetical protein ABUL60_29550 [Myxococcales bacterium]